ncbi:hypothetical protein ACH9L7_02270 [Haloferax sp. S1W]|uniref:hypothetical protein n=1 Tax=Haloferax sp. S1W TaxID=3377110 RepID=UPI0037C903CB
MCKCGANAAWFRDEYEKWQNVDLADGSRVEFYGSLDHFFQAGFAPATPLSLYFGGNVAGYVVSDIVEWIFDVALWTPISEADHVSAKRTK